MLSKPRYGSLVADQPRVEMRFIHGNRYSLDLVGVLINIFGPWMMFATLLQMWSFSFHYKRPEMLYCLTFGVVLGLGVLASVAYKKRKKERASWFGFALMALTLNLFLSSGLGNWNFHRNMQSYYEFSNLNTYPDVNPRTDPGQRIMDAGRVSFTVGTELDHTKAMTFMNSDLFCVVPITNGKRSMDSYDYWAIGVNCCEAAANTFRCGEFNNPFARSGLRLLEDQNRSYFRLAVQQAEATYKIRANHPLFFTWLQDPVAEMDKRAQRGFRFYLLCVSVYFGVHFFLVLSALLSFSSLGRHKMETTEFQSYDPRQLFRS